MHLSREFGARGRRLFGVLAFALLAACASGGSKTVTPAERGAQRAVDACKKLLPLITAASDFDATDVGGARAQAAEPLALEASRLDSQWTPLHDDLVKVGSPSRCRKP